MASTLRQNYTTGDTHTGLLYGDVWAAQTFTVADAHAIDQVDLYLTKVDTPTGTLTVDIYAVDGDGKPTGSALVTGTKAVADIATGPAWVTITFASPYNLTAGTQYAIVMHGPVGDGSNYIGYRTHDNGTYSGGSRVTSANGGTVWTVITAYDNLFKEYGGFNVAGVIPVDKTYSRKLVAIVDNKVWYET